MKKTLVSALTTALVVGAASTTFAAANPFADVPADHWAYDAVAQLVQDGVVNGYGADGTFKGDQNMSRYEMAQIVAKAMAKSDAADNNNTALIEKLSAEFSDELANLGVRV
ncbi:MAG: S-layer homology domain-containing protein, partial [Selenomonadaceae bacterium]|nr:S-layer homology domain-containing protein [Selenomonadaceae bacterium]